MIHLEVNTGSVYNRIKRLSRRCYEILSLHSLLHHVIHPAHGPQPAASTMRCSRSISTKLERLFRSAVAAPTWMHHGLQAPPWAVPASTPKLCTSRTRLWFWTVHLPSPNLPAPTRSLPLHPRIIIATCACRPPAACVPLLSRFLRNRYTICYTPPVVATRFFRPGYMYGHMPFPNLRLSGT
jgi:hypothetical protein